ncbi:MAG: hypothetical protein GY774_28345 [Planctomycetes bacterium]|nr:hypothetical protein [Planctomycetota bacterium]
MTSKKIGSIMFWIGAVYMFVGSWLVMWWVAPIWRNSPDPVEESKGTIWAYQGLAYSLIGLSVPIGVVLAAVGILLCSGSDKRCNWRFAVFVAGVVFVALSMMFPQTLGYYPVVFGISGGLILIFFFATLLFWARNRKTLDDSAKTAADLQLFSYVFFLLSAQVMCALIGNPYSGLFFPERVMQFESLPFYYSMGTKVAIYITLGWIFNFLSQYVRSKDQHQ